MTVATVVFLFANQLSTQAIASSFDRVVLSMPNYPSDGDSTIPGFEGWLNLTELSVQAENSSSPGGSAGLIRFDHVNLKKPTGAASADFLSRLIFSDLIQEARAIILRPGPAGLAPIAAWKFEDTLVSEFEQSTDDAAEDSIALEPTRIAFASVDPDGKVNAVGWDRQNNMVWPNHNLVSELNDLIQNASAFQLAGDFNGDGEVDPADYTVWRDGLNSVYTLGDYSSWSTNYGATAAASAASVPEPGTATLIATLLLLKWRTYRRR